jgi:hypothetical protein
LIGLCQAALNLLSTSYQSINFVKSIKMENL